MPEPPWAVPGGTQGLQVSALLSTGREKEPGVGSGAETVTRWVFLPSTWEDLEGSEAWKKSCIGSQRLVPGKKSGFLFGWDLGRVYEEQGSWLPQQGFQGRFPSNLFSDPFSQEMFPAGAHLSLPLPLLAAPSIPVTSGRSVTSSLWQQHPPLTAADPQSTLGPSHRAGSTAVDDSAADRARRKHLHPLPGIWHGAAPPAEHISTGNTAHCPPRAILTPMDRHHDQRCSKPALTHPYPPSSALKMSLFFTP